MKMLIEENEKEGLISLMGKKVLIITSGYFYTGKLVGVNDTCIKLADPSIVYETGAWSNSSYKDAQPLHLPFFYVQIKAIESFGESK